MSSLEIYCEKIRDLLDCSNSNLQVSRALGPLRMLQVFAEQRQLPVGACSGAWPGLQKTGMCCR